MLAVPMARHTPEVRQRAIPATVNSAARLAATQHHLMSRRPRSTDSPQIVQSPAAELEAHLARQSE
jgi:hypothetical protein